MDKGRGKRVKKSIVTTLLLQIVTLICGLIVPRILLGAYGSEAYGATTSIAQFLSYITLLEGGIGGVARAALYKPLAQKDTDQISIVVSELKHFFRIIAYITIGYAIILACCFKTISHLECYDWMTTFLLVLVIAISTFGQYFIGISYSALIQADQRIYLINALSILTTVINAIAVVVLVRIGSSLIFVKLISSMVFLVKPTAMWLYVRHRYGLEKNPKRDKNALAQRWTGLGQHIAFFIHSNTDVTILTVIDNLKSVSVYSVYHMVTQNIQNIVSSLCAGMESLFGDMIAKGETEKLKEALFTYENVISIACCTLFSTVYVMIIPFVRLYTKGLVDVNYIQPLFSFLITTAAFLHCLRVPYISTITAAGHFKQTRWGAYGEAIINMCLSIVLVWKFGLIGVAIGTVAANGFRMIYTIAYLSDHIVNRPIALFLKRSFINLLCASSISAVGFWVAGKMMIENYFHWILCAALCFLISLVITLLFNLLFYRESVGNIVTKISNILRNKTIGEKNA